MILGDKRLNDMVDMGYIERTYDGAVGPASIDVRLGRSFIRPVPYQRVRLGEEMKYEPCEMHDGCCIIEPGEFILATTMEEVQLPTWYAAFVQGRSSIGRIGLVVQNAGYVDPGFHGHITLELKNDGPCRIELVPGYPVAQLVLMETKGVSAPYQGKYNGQIEATGSRMYMDGTRGVIT